MEAEDLYNTKIDLKDRGREVYEKLLELGFFPNYTDSNPYYFIYSKERVNTGFACAIDYFNEHANKEITIEELFYQGPTVDEVASRVNNDFKNWYKNK